MKKAIFILLAVIGFTASSFGQSSSIDRDSVAQAKAFQTKVKMASLIASNNILADTAQPTRVRQYAQVIISTPNGGEWLAALSYGCMTNPAINAWSVDGDIQFTVNSLFAKYAFAYYKEKQQ